MEMSPVLYGKPGELMENAGSASPGAILVMVLSWGESPEQVWGSSFCPKSGNSCMIWVGKDLQAHLIPMTSAGTSCPGTEKPRKAPKFLTSRGGVLESSKSSQRALKNIPEGLRPCRPWGMPGKRRGIHSRIPVLLRDLGTCSRDI